jgi:alpha-tubulin suppressor-like RCC1 family protein
MVSAGWEYACAVADNRTVWCWGDNSFGQIGNVQTGTVERTPRMVQNLQQAIWVTTGDHHACALKEDSTAWCWGRNEWGQLGNGETYPQSTEPVLVNRPEPIMP